MLSGHVISWPLLFALWWSSMTVDQFRQRLKVFPDDWEIEFSGLTLHRLKARGRNVVNVEFSEVFEQLHNPETKAGLLAVDPNVDEATCSAEQRHTDVATEKIHTLGAWGEAAPATSTRASA